MSDLMTYYVYRQLSDNYFENKSGEDEKKHINDILKISKTVALAFAGNPSGTPADQIAKRVENFVKMVRDESPKHRDIAVTVNKDNLRYYHDFFDPSSDGDQIAVRVTMNSDCVDEIRQEYCYQCGVPGYVAMSDMVRWVILNILEKSRNDESLQTIIKIQHDLDRTLFSDKNDLPESIRFNILRMYLAISFILYDPMDRIGDVYEPRVSHDSFRTLIPTFKVPPITENLMILASSGSENIMDALDLKGTFANIAVFSGAVDAWDQELMLYKARLSFGYRPYNLLVIDDGSDPEWSLKTIISIQNMKWIPKHATFVSDRILSYKIPFTNSIVEISGRDPKTVATDIANMYTIGIRSNDRYAEAIMRTTYKDLLVLAYPGIGDFIDNIPKRSDAMALFSEIQSYLSSNCAVRDHVNKDLVTSLIHIICGPKR